MILGANYYLGEQVCNHFLGDTETHLYITKTHIASDKVVPDLQVTDIAQPRRITCDMVARHRVGVEQIGLRARKSEKAQHVFRVQKLFARHTCCYELS